MLGKLLSRAPVLIPIARALVPSVRKFVQGAIEQDEEKMKEAETEALIRAKYAGLRAKRDRRNP